MRRIHLVPLLLASSVLLAGCEKLGIESVETVTARKEAEGRAIGGACRHAGRAIEDCYILNKRADKAAMFAGWREMNDYMRENKIEAVMPQLSPSVAVLSKPSDEALASTPSESKADEKAASKAASKKDH